MTPLSHSVKTKGRQGDLDHVFLEFYLWYCTLNYFKRDFTPTTLRTGKKSSTFLKNGSSMCVCVACWRIIWSFKKLFLSSPWAKLGGKTCKYEQLAAAVGFFFFLQVYLHGWSLFSELECFKDVFWQERMEERVKSEMKSTELCLNSDCVGLNLSWIILQMIIDIDIL